MSWHSLFEVRDAIAAHLGADRARDLGIEVSLSRMLDVVEVRMPAAGFVITRRALEQAPDAWKAELHKQLDALAALAVDAAPAPSQGSGDGSEQAAAGQEPSKGLPSEHGS